MLEHHNRDPQVPARVVVIGAGGFVGGSIHRSLVARGVPSLALTRGELDLLAVDAAEKLQGLLRPTDSVVLVSALAPVRTAAMLVENLRMAEAACRALAARPAAHLVYVSSDAVYADDANPVTEGACCQPSSLHGVMHLAREAMLRTALKTPLAILRPTLIYGASDPHNGYGPNRFRRQAAKNEPITLFGEGEEMRDHVYIDDVAGLAAATLFRRSSGILNIATGRSFSFREVAERAVTIAGKRAEIRGTPRQNPITHRHFDVTDCLKAFPDFHYTPLQDGMTRAAHEGGGA